MARDVGEHKITVQDGPWPAFPADLTSIAVALATQCDGTALIHEWMFENRMIFTDKLVLMGADITLCDPHRALVSGPVAAARRARRVARHPRRDGDAHRRAVRRGPLGDRQHPPDRPRLRAHRRAPARPRRAHRARRDRAYAARPRGRPATAGSPTNTLKGTVPPPVDTRTTSHPIPSGTRDVLPDEMRELRDITEAVRGRVRARRLRRGRGRPTLEYESDARAAAAERRRRTGSSTTTARSSRCAPT